MNRLRKIAESVNLGNIIDSNKAIQLIQQTYSNKFVMNSLKSDIGVNNPQAILGLISDNGIVIAEMYCFEQPGGGYIGITVGVQIDVSDVSTMQYIIEDNYQCILLNDINNPLGLTELKDIMINGIDLFGMNCTFKNNIKNIDQLFQLLNE